MKSQNQHFWRSRTAAVFLVCNGAVAHAAGLAEYEVIIEAARSGAYAKAATELEGWSAPEPSRQRVNSDLTVILIQAGRADDGLAVARRVGIEGLAPYALKSAAIVARNLQDPQWAVTAYTRLAQLDPADCDAQLGLALSWVDASESAQAGALLSTLEQQCTPADGQFLQSIAQARTYWAARQADVRRPQELLALGWWSEKLEATGSSPPFNESYRAQALREAVFVASRNGGNDLVRRWTAKAAVSLTNEETQLRSGNCCFPAIFNQWH